jgi:hypothetical protein
LFGYGLQGRETYTIYIGVGQQNVSVAIERAATRKRTAEGKDLERLKFSILRGAGSETERISWMDTEEQLHEMQLSTIAIEIIVAGEMQYRELD